ncbi:MAG: phosphate acyltransferase PlsX [Butyrivibrio sp.]|nr:phosphate acyltransferase PlsX [Butyrivibrio sp.]
MSELVRVAVDAMGGDNAPGEIVKGAVAALAASPEVAVTLVGQQERIREVLAGCGPYDEARLNIEDARELIEMAEPPVNAIRTKKDSSIVRGLKLVKDDVCDAYVSAGSTGANLAGGQIIVGRIKAVRRTPLAPMIPTEKGGSLLIDCGANVDARPDHLVMFARMGAIYMEHVMGVKNPTVGLVNIGTEEEKGNALTKETYPLLQAEKDLNFVGNVEARDIPAGGVDVLVCEAFTGNVILKMYEGVAKSLLRIVKNGMMSSVRSKAGALLVKPALKEALKEYDLSKYGGAPLLGLEGLVVKTHGSATATEVQNSILQCVPFVRERVTERIRDALTKE